MKNALLFFIIICIIVNQKIKTDWSEYSFILKPSSLGGIGVFAVHDIPAGTSLFNPKGYTIRTLPIKDVPKEFIKYCIYINDEECICPERFDRMEIEWYINHSYIPNIATIGYVEKEGDTIKEHMYAIKNIKAGDEIVMDYNMLNEPEHLKEDYYYTPMKKSELIR